MESISQLLHFFPLIIVTIGSLVVMMVDAFSKDTAKLYYLSVFFLIAALAASISDVFGPAGEAFYGMAVYGGTSAMGGVIVLLGTLFVVILCKEYLTAIKHHVGEVYSLILFSTVGMLVLVTANDLVTLFLGVETMSIALYVLAGLVKNDKAGAEAALKYFLLGAFATGFFLYGISLLYGAAGSTQLSAVAEVTDGGLIYWGGLALLLVGIFFKISAVPFHMWTPDVYQGAPTLITAYMATASKAAVVVAVILLLGRAFPDVHSDWAEVFQVIAVLTMILGNVIALVQDNMKRMLAYSSIAHVGYMMVGLVAGTAAGYSGVMYYLFAYTIMNVGAFGVVAYYERQKGLDFTNMENYGGLGYKQPMFGVAMSIFMFSLAGIPPFAGFIGKYQVFAAAFYEGYIGLVLVGVITSVIGVYYYIRVLLYLYMREPESDTVFQQPGMVYKFTILILAIMTIYFGIQPGYLSEIFTQGFEQLQILAASGR